MRGTRLGYFFCELTNTKAGEGCKTLSSDIKDCLEKDSFNNAYLCIRCWATNLAGKLYINVVMFCIIHNTREPWTCAQVELLHASVLGQEY
jgi:hypothetical protein